ncbi:MAG: Ig-like domain-containing protein [Candidatus Cybelea sp.]
MPASLTYPGVYIEEISSGVHTITGVATSIAAFVGWAPQGPVSEATLVQSFAEYATIFGGLDSRSKLGHAVNQFFSNGGQQCYIVRLVWDVTLTASPSTNPAVCSTAVATGIGYGSAEIQASFQSVTGSMTVGIGAPVLESIAIGISGLSLPAGTTLQIPPLPPGTSLQLSAAGILSDGSTSGLASVLWASNSSALSVTPSGGLVTAVSQGTATVTATSGLISATITISVTPAPVSQIVVTPSSSQIAVGETLQYAASAQYQDGTSHDITTIAVWKSSKASVTFPTTPGLALASTTDTGVQISATTPWSPSQAGSPPTTLTVTTQVVTAMTVTPANAVLSTSASFTYAVLATYSNGTQSTFPPLPAQSALLWNSSDLSVATIDNTGKLTAAGPGSTTITAAFTDKSLTPNYTISASATLVVKSATLNSVTITPPQVSTPAGVPVQLTATGVFTDGTSVDLTQFANWTGAGPGGIVKSNSAGPITVTAKWMGTSSAPATVTVTAAIPLSLTIGPSMTSIPSGQTAQLKATATFSDGSGPSDVTTSSNWMSSNTNIARVNTTTNKGLVDAIGTGGSLTLFAANPGAWGNNLRLSVTVQPPPNSDHFSILVQIVGRSGQLQTLESFANLSMSSTDPQYAVAVIDNDSSYISFTNPSTGAVPPTEATPTASTPSPVAFTQGADGAVLVPASDQNFEIALTSKPAGGIFLLDRVDIFNLLCVPGETDAATISTLQGYCYGKRAFFIVDAPALSTVAGLNSSGPVGTAAGGGTPGSITGANAINSAYYFPWVLAPDPLAGNRPTLFPPCGFVAGIYAATDTNQGVWKAPAGIDASLTGDAGLQYNLTDLENGSLNPQAINCLRHFKVYGEVLWGARTLAGNDQTGSQWKYIPIRRLALFLESSLYDGTQWVVFEPNDERLWSQIRLNVGAFMQGLFLQGAFAGTTPQQAYFVKCDAENNPDASVALGIVNILVGFAPLYPAEFVVIQIQQIAGQSQ